MPEVIGPLCQAVALSGAGLRRAADPSDRMTDANALLVLNRCVVAEFSQPRHGPPRLSLDDRPIRRWAVETALGQQDELIKAVYRRRLAAVAALQKQGFGWALVRLEPDAPVLVGAAETGIRDVGLALHGSYGWPVIRGSSLKGAAHAYARDEKSVPAARRAQVYGGPRPDDAAGSAARVAAVAFLDAVPSRCLAVRETVMTPHVGEYYTDPSRSAPAEYWNPVPVPFLAVTAGQWTAFLVGDPDGVAEAASHLERAAEDLGLGAKTATGYGYVSATVIPGTAT